MSEADTLPSRIAGRSATIGVIGLGYVGLPLALAFTEAGFDVRGFDIDDTRVERLHAGDSYVGDVSDRRLQAGLNAGFEVGSSPPVVADCDAYIIAVPTGMLENEPDMRAIEDASRTVAAQSPGRETLVVVTSTVYPGATRTVVAPILDNSQSVKVNLAMVPERINPGGNYDFEEIPLIVGADTNDARNAAATLFDTVVAKTHTVGSTESAELAKTLENTYRMVNIALVNQLLLFTEELEADVWEAIQAASTKPFGFQAFHPGPGIGGHCIPVDPQFLIWRAEDVGTDVSFVDDALQINQRMPEIVVNRLSDLLQARGVELKQANITVLGAAYKPNVGDTRNSPALRIIELLSDRSKITVVDPEVDPANLSHDVVATAREADLQSADAVVLLVDHDEFDLETVGHEAEFVFDTRNAMADDATATIVTIGDNGKSTKDIDRVDTTPR